MSRWRHVLSETAIGLRRNLLMTFAVVLSVAVSLTLFGAALLLSRQVDRVADDWQGRIEVSIFLCDDARCPAITDVQQDDLRNQLGAEPVVAEVFFESKQEAYRRFVEQFADQPDLVDTVSPEALPASFRVKLADPEQFDVIADRFDAFPGVEQVVDQRETLRGFLDIAGLIRDAALLVAIIQLIAGAVLIANTIRVAAFARREQTSVMKLVGASNWYVRLPFVFEGMAEGLAGALLAWGLLQWSVPEAIQRASAQVAFVPFIGADEIFQVGLILSAVGLGLAAVSSLVSLQRFLDV
jgi:cell division transport system permease protein